MATERRLPERPHETPERLAELQNFDAGIRKARRANGFPEPTAATWTFALG
jgi:hypothetical protein